MNEDKLFNIKVCQTTEDLYQESGSAIEMHDIRHETLFKLIPIFVKCGMTIVIEPISV